MFSGITYKDKHSYKDFGVIIKSRDIPPPGKIKYKDSVPFMNGAYDFSSLYGGQTYSERELTYVFDLSDTNKIGININKTKILDWLMNSFKGILKDDTLPGFYFFAECESVDFKEVGLVCELTAKFKAYPFMIGNSLVGHEGWDDFIFELDYMQETEFDVVGSKTVTVYNLGRDIVPIVNCSSSMTCVLNGYTANFVSGDNEDFDFILKQGANQIVITGTGHIEFNFREERL